MKYFSRNKIYVGMGIIVAAGLMPLTFPYVKDYPGGVNCDHRTFEMLKKYDSDATHSLRIDSVKRLLSDTNATYYKDDL